MRRTTSGGLTCPKSGLFVVTQQMGAKNAKMEESESKKGQKMTGTLETKLIPRQANV